MWAIGVCAYLLISGRFPFEDALDKKESTIKHNILKAKFDFKHDRFATQDSIVKNFIRYELSKTIHMDNEKQSIWTMKKCPSACQNLYE